MGSEDSLNLILLKRVGVFLLSLPVVYLYLTTTLGVQVFSLFFMLGTTWEFYSANHSFVTNLLTTVSLRHFLYSLLYDHHRSPLLLLCAISHQHPRALTSLCNSSPLSEPTTINYWSQCSTLCCGIQEGYHRYPSILPVLSVNLLA